MTLAEGSPIPAHVGSFSSPPRVLANTHTVSSSRAMQPTQQHNVIRGGSRYAERMVVLIRCRRGNGLLRLRQGPAGRPDLIP
jgi:hypothetical protein